MNERSTTALYCERAQRAITRDPRERALVAASGAQRRERFAHDAAYNEGNGIHQRTKHVPKTKVCSRVDGISHNVKILRTFPIETRTIPASQFFSVFPPRLPRTSLASLVQ